MAQNLTRLTAARLSRAILSKEVSSVEVLEAHLARIQEENPRLNAVVTLDEEGARRRASEADEATARGVAWGPLHGLPMTLKDGHSTKGLRTTCGYEPLADYAPQEDGTVAARLKAAGAIIVGKTNVPPLLGDMQADNPIFGRTNNPWNVERTPGGSSGGAAAALAVGMTPLEIGSDLAGSIRTPAHFCGVYGLKTTQHRVSMWGHIPPVPDILRRTPSSWSLMWSIGPMARSVEDLVLGYRIISGPDGFDTDVPPVATGEAPHMEVKGLRIAFALTFPGVPVAASIHDALARTLSKLGSAGATVEERLPAVDFRELARARAVLTRVVDFDQLVWRAQHWREEDLAEGEPPPSMATFLAALDTRERIIRVWEAFFEQWDALICPVSMTTAFPHCPVDTPLQVDGETVNYWRALGHTAPFNFTGHPSVVIPIARDSEGLPIGAQIVGKRWGEEKLLGVAAQVVEVAGYS